MTPDAGWLPALREALGEAVRTDPELLDAARADRSGHVAPHPPLAVVEPVTIEQVQATLRVASAHGIPIVPRGAGTGLAGGAIGTAGEVVLSTRRLDRVLEVSPDDEIAVVEAGVRNGELNDLVAAHGLWFAPDPASRAISTIGGNIATNAGGLLCAKYGVTREAVLGLKVVLADGRLLTLGRRTVKGVTGLDLTALMIGSEGTLGVIVEATVRLRRRPRGEVATLFARFGTVEQAARAASAIAAGGLAPAVLEIIDPLGVELIGAFLERRMPPVALLIAQADGPAAAEEAAEIAALVRALGGEVSFAADPEEGARLFEFRRSANAAFHRPGTTTLIEDVAVPRSRLPEMFAEIGRIAAAYGIEIPTVAHAGDGNLHPTFVVDAPTVGGHVDIPAHVWAAADELFQACLRLGGTLTGEHGVGVLKRRWLRDELGEDAFDLQRRIKALFDPAGILNPGKVFGPA